MTIDYLQKQIREQNDEITQTKNMSLSEQQKWVAERKNLQAQLAQANEQYKKYKSESKKHKKSIAKLKEKFKTILQDLQQQKKELEIKLLEEQEDKNAKIQDAWLEQQKYQKKIRDLENERDKLRYTIDQLEKPTLDPVRDTIFSSTIKQVQELNNRADNLDYK